MQLTWKSRSAGIVCSWTVEIHVRKSFAQWVLTLNILFGWIQTWPPNYSLPGVKRNNLTEQKWNESGKCFAACCGILKSYCWKLRLHYTACSVNTHMLKLRWILNGKAPRIRWHTLKPNLGLWKVHQIVNLLSWLQLSFSLCFVWVNSLLVSIIFFST